MHTFVCATAAAVATSPSCAVLRGARVTRVVDHATATGCCQKPHAFEVEVEGNRGANYEADSVIVAGQGAVRLSFCSPSHAIPSRLSLLLLLLFLL